MARFSLKTLCKTFFVIWENFSKPCRSSLKSRSRWVAPVQSRAANKSLRGCYDLVRTHFRHKDIHRYRWLFNHEDNNNSHDPTPRLSFILFRFKDPEWQKWLKNMIKNRVLISWKSESFKLVLLLLLSSSTVNVCSLLQETLIGVWSWAERASEWTSKRVREREREDRRGKPVSTGNESCRRPLMPGQTTPPLTWTHTLTPHRGARSRGGEAKPGAGVRGQGSERRLSFFFVCCLRWRKNKTTVWTRERNAKTTEHLTGRLKARQTGSGDASPPAEIKRGGDTILGKRKNLRVDDKTWHET